MGKVGMPLRVAVTGAGRSPALDVCVHAGGKTAALAYQQKRWALSPSVNQR